MTLLPVSLQSLNPEYIDQMFERAKSDEAIFRNILVDLSDDAKEADFFKTGSLDDIFNQYVRVSGYETRVSDFRVGPFVEESVPELKVDGKWDKSRIQNFALRYMSEPIYGSKFPNFDTSALKSDQAFVLIEKSNDTWLKLYNILENSAVKASGSEHYHQF